MLRYALIFLLVAIGAGILGFASLAGVASWIAKAVLLVFLALFLVTAARAWRPA